MLRLRNDSKTLVVDAPLQWEIEVSLRNISCEVNF